ncbi:predicted protein [Botrytis cinerea T4]|uniref:Uncharacterized protein n=1 Tax=Botryotinia fuckeliana (strain T4) TaxID=999810 RepID=G2YIV7_BOTF4|nr:predicted protein [Botrytis cinerea T4]
MRWHFFFFFWNFKSKRTHQVARKARNTYQSVTGSHCGYDV